VNGIVIMSEKETDHIADLTKTFDNMRRNGLYVVWTSLGPLPLGGYQDRLLGGPLGLLSLCHTAPDGVGRKDFDGEVLG
jgi:hypothetical protein